MSTLKYALYGSSIAVFANTELASLPNAQGVFGAGAGLTSNVWDNTSLRYPEADFILNLGSIAAPAGGSILLGLLWSPDGGTTFPDPQYASGQSANHLPLGGTPTYTQAVLVSTSAKKIIIPGVKLRPGKAMFILHNLIGVTLAATGNTLVMYPATFEIV